MIDLYRQFAAWAKQPLMITNWTAILFYVFAIGLIYGVMRELHQLQVHLAKVLDIMSKQYHNE